MLSKTHMYKCFIDLSKAYDRVDRPLLWELLRRLGLPPHLVLLLENLHSGSTAVIFTPGCSTPSEKFDLERGLKQGSVLAPLLFNLFSGAMIKHWKSLLGNSQAGIRVVYNINSSPLDMSDHHGSQLNDNPHDPLFPGKRIRLQEILYADDCVIYAESEAQLQQLVTAYNKAATDFGQQVSPSKSKVMVVQSPEDELDPIPVVIRLAPTDQESLQVVKVFSYLGSLDSNDGNTANELDQRIARIRGAYFRLQGRVFENNALSLTPKLLLFFKMFIVPVALYGCATWDLTVKQMGLLDKTQYRLLRRILRLHVPAPEFPKQISYIDLLDAA